MSKSKSSNGGKHNLFDMPPDWKLHWRGMPEFFQDNLEPYQSVLVHFRCQEDREAFSELVGRSIGPPGRQVKNIWFPREEQDPESRKRWRAEVLANPCWPVYVISKGRWESRLTVRSLEGMKVPHRVVVEPQEQEQYASVMDPGKILVLPFSNLGQGSIPARNWVWEHALASGAERHWILDDNIDGFHRMWRNTKSKAACGNIFAAAEAFVDRYENVGLAGFHYYMFAPRKTVMPPYYLNTRVYSCILIRNDLPFRWRGKYNEDTDLSLRVLKAGHCTVLFNAFLAHKVPTMTMTGGNTDVLYQGDGRKEMAESLREQHPDLVTVTRKWHRWQHHVDYSRFARNKLRPKGSLESLPEVNNFGMHLERDEDMPLLLIGEAPGNGDGGPLEGRIGKKLAKLAGISYEEYLGCTQRMNLLSQPQGKGGGKGDTFDEEATREAAEALKDELYHRRVVLLGRRVAKAFGVEKADLPLLTWKKFPALKADLAVMPHPSGVVRWYNDPENLKAASSFLQCLLGGKDVQEYA